MAVAYMHKRMLEEGFYFSSSVYDECAVQCLGKANIVNAKQDLTKFTHTHNMVSLNISWLLYLWFSVVCTCDATVCMTHTSSVHL